MTITQDVLLDYVMGALTPEEEREVALYLNEHPEEAREVRDLFAAMADVALNLEPETLAADAEESLLARIRLGSDIETSDTQDVSEVSLEAAEVIQLEAQEDTNEERPKQFYMDPDFFGKENTVHLPKQEKTAKPPTWLTGLALAAAIGAFLYLGFRAQVDPAIQQLANLCEQDSSRCDILTDENNIELGTLAKREDNSLLLVLNENPPEGQVYQAWEIADGTPKSLGIWDGRVLNIEASLDQDSLFGVSIEPSGGSEQPTSTPILLVPLTS